MDREVELSGAIHNKGVLQVENVMRFRYGQTRPLPAKLSVIFDQSYGPIDGDSASSTEFYAMVSALSGIPIRQDLAVTGAVGLRGEVLAIGGVNEKIEGFFEICRLRGLTGTQGVLVPESNLGDLMLPPEVLAAVRARRFHVYGIAHVDQGLTLLTGCEAAAIDAKVRERLEQLYRESKDEDDGKTKTVAPVTLTVPPRPAPPPRPKRRRPRKGERDRHR